MPTIGNSFRLSPRLVILGVILLVLALAIIPVAKETVRQPEAHANAGELIVGTEIGQTFQSPYSRLSGVSITMATYSDRSRSGDVIFELRRNPEDTEVLRSVTVPVTEFSDRVPYNFTFSPVPDSAGETFYASLHSPGGTPGNAVTAFIANSNPYRESEGALHIWRDLSDRKNVSAVRKANADLTFSLVHQRPLGSAVLEYGQASIQSLTEDPARARMLGLLAGAAVLLAVGSFWQPRQQQALRVGILVVVIVGILLRLLYATHLPYTNDEHTQLYDAWAVSQGRLPAGDGILKTPVTIGILAGILSVAPADLLTGRAVSVTANMLTLLVLVFLLRRIEFPGTPSAILVWLLASGVVVFSLYLHAQPLQLFIATSVLALWVTALTTPALRQSLLLAAGAGILAALAFGARKTSLAIALPALTSLLLVRSWRRTFVVAGTTLAAAAIGFGLLILLVGQLYGPAGIQYFLGTDIANIDPAVTASAEERAAAFINGVLPAFRELFPVIALALVGLGAGLLNVARRWISHPYAVRLVWLLPLIIAIGGRNFYRVHAGLQESSFGLERWWTLLPWLIGACVFLPLPKATSTESYRKTVLHLVLPLIWLAGVTVLYASWIKFTANYLSEFLPPLVLLAALGVYWLRESVRPVAGRVVIAFLLIIAVYGSARSSYVFEHTGTFDVHSVREAADILRASVPPGTPILTAAVAIPLLSGHSVLLDIAHPTHYAYGYIEPHVRDIYMPTKEEMVVTVFRDAQWMLLERLTAFTYFREYPEIEEFVKENFEPIATIENLSNPCVAPREATLWRSA